MWATQLGGDGGETAVALAVSGTDVYVAGTFTGTAAFGPVTLTTTGAPAYRDSDVYVAKLTAAGAVTWAQGAGGPGSDVMQGLAVSGSSVYVAGSFGGDAAGFGGVPLSSASPGGPFSTTAFVAKLTDAGGSAAFAWAQALATGVATRGAEVYVAGAFTGTARLGSAVLASAGSVDAFGARLTDLGATARVEWARAAGGPGYDGATALALTPGGLYLAGAFSATAGLGTTALTSAGDTDAFVAQLTDAGAVAWARRAGGTGPDGATALAVRGAAVYAAGSFREHPAEVGGTVLPNAGGTDVFVARFTDAGAAVWALGAGGPGLDAASGLAVAGPTLYVAGWGHYPMRFGPWTLTAPTPARGEDGFLAALDEAPRIAGPALLCAGAAAVLAAPPGARAYRWNTGDTTATLAVGQAGRYTVVCTFADGTVLTLQHEVAGAAAPAPFFLGADTTLCAGDALVLRGPASAPGLSYRWSDGSEGPTLRVQQAGEYTLRVATACGSTTARRRVADGP
ncbi:hypothetical protein F0P96_18660 [Hymenobacter busanensis]|uniref:Uncharacterized protein n=1 Tax=Hymenobacter busanensis TaxID=2607656 RepID=A0A7L4ZRU6_9BACT|nr:hypothetical protein [Hymenobacter busanensis]KAA9327254.1 hypothetical protein F0P96_18660 [Hymenobacter busanensis]QHJ05919.1 hypothetical protein GUY19_00865 [Hymenobacter busanensis]